MNDTRSDQLAEVAQLFGRSTRVLDPIRLQVWDHLGIAQPQLRILFRIRQQPGIDLRGLAAGLGISPSAASQQVDKLVARQLLERRPDPGDRRRLQLELTPLGSRATRAISSAAIEYVASLLAELSGEELAVLGRLLNAVLTAAEAAPPPVLDPLEDLELPELRQRR